MRQIWPRSLAGRMILLLLLALALAQAVSFTLFLSERQAASRLAASDYAVSRIAAMVQLLDDTPPALHERVAKAGSSGAFRFTLSGTPWVELETSGGPEAELGDDLLAALALTPDRILVGQAGAGRGESLAISVRLAGGGWLNVRLAPKSVASWQVWPLLGSIAVTAAALVAIVVLMVRRITRPMTRLVAAADRLGRGETLQPLVEEGPEDLRRTTRAFNQMQERLDRFIGDRTRMLAAISHDLRTPITALRLRAEFIDNHELRSRIVGILDEMQRMTEETLSFAREEEEGSREATRRVDLTALVDSVCQDVADLGRPVSFANGERVTLACRPLALKRAIRNVVENAVCYGASATVALTENEEIVVIRIDDHGPGIPECEFDRAFEPFVRLEGSRSRETGGIGLGLAIARNIVRGHGGDIGLANRPRGGLSVEIRLPRALG